MFTSRKAFKFSFAIPLKIHRFWTIGQNTNAAIFAGTDPCSINVCINHAMSHIFVQVQSWIFASCWYYKFFKIHVLEPSLIPWDTKFVLRQKLCTSKLDCIKSKLHHELTKPISGKTDLVNVSWKSNFIRKKF